LKITLAVNVLDYVCLCDGNVCQCVLMWLLWCVPVCAYVIVMMCAYVIVLMCAYV